MSPAAEARLAAIRERAAHAAGERLAVAGAAIAASRHPAAELLPAEGGPPCQVCEREPAAVLLARAAWGSEPRPACPRCVARQRTRSTYTGEPYVTRPLDERTAP